MTGSSGPAGAGPDGVAGAVGELQRRFPEVSVWFGAWTGHWWALVFCGYWRLVEAWSPGELGRAIEDASSWPWPWPGARL